MTLIQTHSCEDSDPECRHCAGRCTRSADVVLQRIDGEDLDGTLFCDPCSEDALESGCFMVKDDSVIQHDMIVELTDVSDCRLLERESEQYDHFHPGSDCRYLGNDLWDCGVTDSH